MLQIIFHRDQIVGLCDLRLMTFYAFNFFFLTAQSVLILVSGFK